MTPDFNPFPEKETKSDGLILVPRFPGYSSTYVFEREMAKAIDRTEAILTTTLIAGNVSPEQVWSLLKDVGKTRGKIAQMVNGYSGDYGRPTPKNLEEFIEFVDQNKPIRVFRTPQQMKEIAVMFENERIYDTVTPTNRHQAVFPKLLRVIPTGKIASDPKVITVKRNGQSDLFTLSHLIGSEALITVVHPKSGMNKKTVDYAMSLIADAINDHSLGEKEFVNELAKAHFLLSQGTPFINGSPACVLALFESAMRAKFGKTLGRLKPGIELFWEAIVLGLDGQQGYEKFVDGYRNYFE